jgi:3-oxoacyl-[acyl-carrier protein] reductase
MRLKNRVAIVTGSAQGIGRVYALRLASDERAAATRCLKRSQVPEDLAGSVVFLAPEDSAFMTGQMIVVDGGNSLH